jgi:hypothetical protein
MIWLIMVAIPPVNTLISEVILIALIAVVLLIIFKIGKTILEADIRDNNK